MDYIIGFDLNRNMVRLFDPAKNACTEFPTVRKLVNSGDYANMLQFALRETKLSGADVRVALPDSATACDFITIPRLGNQTKNAMKVEFEKLYTNFSELKINSEEFNPGKKYRTDMFVMARQSLLDSVTEGVKALGCNLRGITSSPNGVGNAFLALGGKTTNVTGFSGGSEEGKGSALSSFLRLKKQPNPVEMRGYKDPLPNTVLFVDVQRYVTRMVLSGKSLTLCSLSQPLGYAHLPQNKVLQEYMLVNHDVAELAVLNAIETAKRKKQTVSIAADLTDEEDEADEAYMEMLEALSNKDGAPIPKKKTEEDDSAEFYDDPEEQKAQAAAMPSEPKPFDKIQKKVEKKYPKFMLRERPADAEGYVMENFRMLQKYILLFLQGLENSETFIKPETVVMNLPPEFSFIPSKLNEEGDNRVNFVLLENGSGLSAAALENLDLYGATLMDRYNKSHNF